MDFLTGFFNPEIARANKNNKIAKDVKESREVSLSRYFASLQGNFFVTGDDSNMDYYRRIAILGALENHPNMLNSPVVILSRDKMLEDELIEMATSGRLRRDLVVKSERHPNYHFFYDWSVDDTLECIGDIASMMGISRGDVQIYGRAFLNILKTQYPISLPAMLNLAKYSDQKIIDIGKKSNLDSDIMRLRQILQTNPGISGTFGDILTTIQNCVSSIMHDENIESKFDLYEGTKRNRIVFIRFSGNNYRVFNICMYYELKKCQGRKINIIVDDMVFTDNDPLLNMVMNSVIQNGILGLVSRNVQEMVHSTSLTGFNSQIILQCSVPAITESYLNACGSYRHQDVDIHGMITYYQRPRITYDEMGIAVLKGHRGRTIENTSNLVD